MNQLFVWEIGEDNYPTGRLEKFWHEDEEVVRDSAEDFVKANPGWEIRDLGQALQDIAFARIVREKLGG